MCENVSQQQSEAMGLNAQLNAAWQLCISAWWNLLLLSEHDENAGKKNRFTIESESGWILCSMQLDSIQMKLYH